MQLASDFEDFIKLLNKHAVEYLVVLAEFGFSSLGYRKEDFLKESIINQIGYPPLIIDILTSIDGVTFSEAVTHKLIIDIDSTVVAFIGLNQLIANKKASNRPQDIQDIVSLQKGKKDE